MHHQMGSRNTLVDLAVAVDSQDIAGGWTAELVGAVAGTTSDRQGIDTGFGNKVCRLFGIGEHLLMGQLSLCALPVFFARLAGFQGAEATQLTLHGDTTGVGISTLRLVTSTLYW